MFKKKMKKSKSELPIFYETAHAELASALEMLAACKVTDSPKQAFGYFMHAKDEYSHAKCFFKMLSQRARKVSIEKAREFRFTPPSLITKGYISNKGFLIDTMKLKDFIAFVYTNELLAKSSFENILKNSSKYSIKLTNLKEFLIKKPNLQIWDPSPSSWGQGGYHNYWINNANAWIVPEITKAGSTFVDLCSKNFNNDLSSRLFKQAARELLLSESSDWSFILRAGTTTELAKERIERHLSRFWKLVEMIKNDSNINLNFLEDIEEEDKVFPDINIDDWRK